MLLFYFVLLCYSLLYTKIAFSPHVSWVVGDFAIKILGRDFKSWENLNQQI